MFAPRPGSGVVDHRGQRDSCLCSANVRTALAALAIGLDRVGRTVKDGELQNSSSASYVDPLPPTSDGQLAAEIEDTGKGRRLKTAGLFAGIGGLELGLERSGHETLFVCDTDPASIAVLETRFPAVECLRDVRDIDTLPDDTTLLACGFPCQNLSQAGRTAGIEGSSSSRIGEALRLAEHHGTPWILLENVPFMLQLDKGKALHRILGELERLGYRWAYRVVDTRAFGLPQRRERVYILASLEDDPRTVLFADDCVDRTPDPPWHSVACGFYWTEGNRGLGWAIDAVPPLKSGSGVGIPSAPAVIMPSGNIVTPTITDAERLQGFPRNWTKPAEGVGRASFRWRLVGNAVSVPVAKWIGSRLRRPGIPVVRGSRRLAKNAPWPKVAWNVDGERCTGPLSPWPKQYKRRHLDELISIDALPLSERATAGFFNRAKASSLKFPEGFLERVEGYLGRVQNGRQ